LVFVRVSPFSTFHPILVVVVGGEEVGGEGNYIDILINNLNYSKNLIKYIDITPNYRNR
jgi:hypothetical protein